MGRRIIHRFLIAAMAICFALPAITYAQPSDKGSTDVFGLNPLLYNGRYYSYFPAAGTIGTPYLENSDFALGTVTVRGVQFTGLTLNYDVYNQQLVLKFKDAIGAVSQIIISDAWLEGFSLGDMAFRVLQTSDTSKRIFRVTGSGPYYIMEYTSKTVALDNQMGATNYRFSNIKTARYLQTETGLNPFTGNKSYLSLFTSEKQLLIRKYLRENRVRLRKCNDRELLGLINFCNKL